MLDEIKILMVDDEARNLDTLETILNDPSYVLLRADNADLALKHLLEHDVAAMVLDIKMPGVSGFELANLIKGTKKFRHIPIVFLTAYMLDEQDVMTGYGAGAVDYLTKPINPIILRHKVAVFADLFRKTRALATLNEQLEARVRERTAELEHASRMKDEFLAMISHELRTPLNAMLGWAAILQQEPRNAEKVKRGVDVIHRNARAQERIVTDLLDVSRIISGKLRLSMTKFPLASAIRAAVDSIRPAADAKGLALAIEIAADVGEIVGDAGRLQQVIWNLLINAVRYTPPGGRVSVVAERKGGDDLVRVADTGVGIPPEHLPHIFERFRQVDSSTTRAHGGLGLGLALVRHLVEAHGGTVAAHSAGAGLGATFTVTLPVRLELADGDSTRALGAVGPGAASELADAPSARRVALEDVRVLVVDNDADSLELLRVVLEDAGACVTVASDVIGALSAFDAGAFDIVVSDIGMPGMDGYAFMRRIRSAPDAQAVPAIAVTAYTRAEDVQRANAAGYQEHFSKPIDSRKLVDAIKTLVRNYRSGGGGTRVTA